MSDVKLVEIEKDLSMMKANVAPLMEEMKKSTKAQIELTHEIKNLVGSMNRAEEKITNVDGRVTSLETKEAVRAASDVVMTWVKRTIIVALVAAFMGLILVKTQS